MAHFQKFTRGAIGPMLSHYDRSKGVGENVDRERTQYNYNLAEHQNLKQLDFVHTRMKSIRVQKRADVNIFCDWIVTFPKELNRSVEVDFFRNTYKFLENKYGKDNVISAYVHKDETTPHMHFAFMPVVKDLKKGGYKLSAKECVKRQDLKTFHTELEKYLREHLGFDVGVLNESTKNGSLSILEQKTATAMGELQKTQDELFFWKETTLEPLVTIPIIEPAKNLLGIKPISYTEYQKLVSHTNKIYEQLQKAKNSLNVVNRENEFYQSTIQKLEIEKVKLLESDFFTRFGELAEQNENLFIANQGLANDLKYCFSLLSDDDKILFSSYRNQSISSQEIELDELE